MESYIVLDLETTGFNPSTCEIIEIGAWKVVDGVVVDKFSELVKPLGYLPMHIQQITGITQDMVKSCDTIDTILSDFHNWCEDLPFLGYNLPFDYSFLIRKGNSLGLDFTLNNTRTGIDVLTLCRQYYKDVSHKLVDMVNLLNIKVDSNESFHRAGYDAYMTKLVYDRLLDSYSTVYAVTTPQNLAKTDEYGHVKNTDTLSFE